MTTVRIMHFSDTLCVWAYVSQIRIDELLERFSGQIELESRFFSVFGSTNRKIESQWSDRGGLRGYADHVKKIVADFGYIQVHPQVWEQNTPSSSMPSHAFLCAVRCLEEQGTVGAGATRKTAWAVRKAFFADNVDISKKNNLLGIADQIDLPVGLLEELLDDGQAYAALSEDLDLARDQSVRASPSLIFNEGRQKLTGNVGYRIIEANVRELMRPLSGQHSWC
jgi:predicted DsbA family dithiol-disulfide isomerase